MIHNLDLHKLLYPDAEIIEWNQLFRHTMSRKVSTEMLGNDGESYVQECRKNGDRLRDPSYLRIVIYNRQYAVKKLQVDLKLLIDNLNEYEFKSLMEQVYFEE
jgi:hypothetical protein